VEYINQPMAAERPEEPRQFNGVPVCFVRHARARRYILRVRPDGSARVTIPRGGTRAEAEAFLARQAQWLQRRIAELQANPVATRQWTVGAEILFRGEKVRIEAVPGDGCRVRFGTETVAVPDLAADLRPLLERHLWRLACEELPARLLVYASLHDLPVRRVTVRNQRTRWGSCSRRGNISLNWRLVQVPPFVRDYICLHELMHLREMNHSPRFWRQVASVCPYYQVAERWLKAHARLLH